MILLFCRTAKGMTPLHTACSYGKLDIVTLLLKAGAELRSYDLQNLSPLHMAVQEGHLEIVASLLEHADKAFEEGFTQAVRIVYCIFILEVMNMCTFNRRLSNVNL